MIRRPEYDMKVVGKNLKRLREAKNLSVDQVREYLCLGSVQAVYKYEKGLCYPQADTMFALMELYDAQIKDIVTNSEEDLASSSFLGINVLTIGKNSRLSRAGLNYWLNDIRESLIYTCFC